LTIETLRGLIDAGRPADALDIVDSLGSDDRAHGRIRLLEAAAALRANDLDRAGAILAEGVIPPDFGGHTRQDEIWPDLLWYELHERQVAEAEGIPLDDALRLRVRRDFPLPAIYDHRDHRDASILEPRPDA
jgi:hypothetical protein